MKKTVILILAVLPIVLLITIAFAGRILSSYQHISVERVLFVDDKGVELPSSYLLMLDTGETKSTAIKIYPELSTDKRVTYASSDTSVCTVDERGAVTGVSAGSAIITVRTNDGDKIAMLDVRVTADRVTGVTLSPSTLEMMIGESRTLQAVVEPFVALEKSVTFKSSNTGVVTVNASGKITAVGAGTAVITVTTKDGGFTATCTVTVTEDTPPLLFDFSSAQTITATGNGYITTLPGVDLTAYLCFDESKINGADIRFRIEAGDDAVIDEAGVLTFSHTGIVNVCAYVGDAQNPTYQTEVRIAWFS